MSKLILRRLAEVFPIVTYSGEVELLDENKDPHRFSILRAYDVDIYVDEKGHFWMREAEIRDSLGISKTALNNAITRYMHSALGARMGKVHRLWTFDAVGRNFPMNFYNEATFATVIARMQKDHIPEAALKFIEDREKIILGFRTLIYEISLRQEELIQEQAQNLQLQAQKQAEQETELEKMILETITHAKQAGYEHLRLKQLEQHLRRLIGDEKFDDLYPKLVSPKEERLKQLLDHYR